MFYLQAPVNSPEFFSAPQAESFTRRENGFIGSQEPLNGDSLFSRMLSSYTEYDTQRSDKSSGEITAEIKNENIQSSAKNQEEDEEKTDRIEDQALSSFAASDLNTLFLKFDIPKEDSPVFDEDLVNASGIDPDGDTSLVYAEEPTFAPDEEKEADDALIEVPPLLDQENQKESIALDAASERNIRLAKTSGVEGEEGRNVLAADGAEVSGAEEIAFHRTEEGQKEGESSDTDAGNTLAEQSADEAYDKREKTQMRGEFHQILQKNSGTEISVGSFYTSDGRGEKADAKDSGKKKEEGLKTRGKSLKVEVNDLRSTGDREGIHAEKNDEATRAMFHNSGREFESSANNASETRTYVSAGDLKDGRAHYQFKAESSLENFLARELHQNLNGDIVRQARLMLHDGGEGTIRLSLRPASLGKVKIRLEMSENKITGHIIVESKEALRAFESEIHNLEEAFRNSGFEGASLNTELASDSGRGGKNGSELNDELKVLTEMYSAGRYEGESRFASSSRVYDSIIGTQQVNIFA
ncbi:MAG: flagellar hook-length control protein FliK [Spirochaetaceae bacterium]|nr:flagellar hook-length control protein FliK [Spirochaetaceae bacterium]